MAKKTIFVILPHLGGGGAERSTLNLINYWSKKNYNIFLILMNKKGELIEEVNEEIKIIDLNCKRIIHTIIPCNKLMRKHKPDITLVLMWPLTSVVFCSWLLSFKIGKLYLADHNPFIDLWFKDFNINKYIFYLTYNLTYSFATGIICVSKNVKYEIENMLLFKNKNIYHINNSIKNYRNNYDIIKLKKSIFGDVRFCFLSVGRLKKSRDVITVIKALKNFKYLNSTKLIILGTGPEENNLKRYVNQHKLDKFVEFKGFVKDTHKYYIASDLYIHSSLYDALPLTLIEALYSNTKILSTDCKYGPAEILKKYDLGVLVETNNHEDLLRGIYVSLDKNINFELRNKTKKNYSIEFISEKYLDIFFN